VAQRNEGMKYVPNALLLFGCLLIFGSVFHVRGAGDIVKIDTLSRIKWPFRILVVLAVLSLLISLIRSARKSYGGSKERFRVMMDVSSLLLLGFSYWLITRM